MPIASNQQCQPNVSRSPISIPRENDSHSNPYPQSPSPRQKGRWERHYLIQINHRLPKLSLHLVEVSHPDLSKVTWMVFVQIRSVMMLSTCETATYIPAQKKAINQHCFFKALLCGCHRYSRGGGFWDVYILED